jgi:hypothetical protein
VSSECGQDLSSYHEKAERFGYCFLGINAVQGDPSVIVWPSGGSLMLLKKIGLVCHVSFGSMLRNSVLGWK